MKSLKCWSSLFHPQSPPMRVDFILVCDVSGKMLWRSKLTVTFSLENKSTFRQKTKLYCDTLVITYMTMILHCWRKKSCVWHGLLFPAVNVKYDFVLVPNAFVFITWQLRTKNDSVRHNSALFLGKSFSLNCVHLTGSRCEVGYSFFSSPSAHLGVGCVQHLSMDATHRGSSLSFMEFMPT